jgi:hypothetical protein
MSSLFTYLLLYDNDYHLHTIKNQVLLSNFYRKGSSKGKIGRTRVIGAKKVLKDFKLLTNTLQDLMRKHGRSDTKALQKAYKAVRTQVKAN